MDALDLDVEQRVGIDRDAEPVADELGERALVGALDRGEALAGSRRRRRSG